MSVATCLMQIPEIEAGQTVSGDERQLGRTGLKPTIPSYLMLIRNIPLRLLTLRQLIFA